LNGCCYGNVTCNAGPAIEFPLSAQPRFEMTKRGYQTAAGFTLTDGQSVGAVEPGSAAERAGLRAGDIIQKINGQDVVPGDPVAYYLVDKWPRGMNDLQLSVQHKDGSSA